MIAQPDFSACPCGRGVDYSACCGRHHAGQPATNAEDLMRSRYSAYVLADGDYLLDTWHASTRPASLDFSDAAQTRWLGLEVKRYEPVTADTARVEFVARYRIGGGRAERLHERSDFVRENGRWFYLQGEFP